MDSPLEHILISTYKVDMIAFMNTHPEAFDEAVTLALSDKQPYSWRAAWLLWSCMKENDRRVKKHLGKIVAYLPVAKDNQKRELLKILFVMELDDEQEGRVFDACIALWKDITKDPSIRVNAFKMLLKIAEKYPELMHEILMLTDTHYLATLSPGAQHSVSKLIKCIKT
ncbi:MAG: hypothetical protein HYV28_00545 [Ignavibacteriales bacterium]|nr:hypothetical protein [Ignavibacteriales bacterium]